MKRRSLRVRVALIFAGFGALISLILSIAIYVAVHDFGQRLIYETLHAESQDYLARLARTPDAMLPATRTLSGYALGDPDPRRAGPPALAVLPPGNRAIELDGRPYLARVVESGNRRYAFLFDVGPQLQRERNFLYYLIAGMVAMTGLSALGGFWLARRVVAPVTDLAARVAALEAPAAAVPAPPRPSQDEVDELAHAFDRYHARIQACVERERAFTADVSHELRTPLAIIRGAVEVLESDTALNNSQRQRIARIERASHDMTDLTGALLHLARESGAGDGAEEGCSIAEVVHGSVAKQRNLAGDGGVEFHVDAEADLQIRVAKTLAAVVVDNLIDNAVRHSRSGRIHVRLAERRLEVSDSGCGIAEDELERVFRRHYRGVASDGAGIGLSLVKRICELHGWRIAIASQTGSGTTATLIFPPE
ncbi:HAMP domain-containing histidine kinase [Parasulfuritortus cantonensis]|uniref:histidine kinase n=1 Tax=Parasulfuritortus cantonensis TaxID=2528202 RepID=A0A4R1BS91_9PROT|nr:HAMP domain-containing sensor histidine kinase [Parasulfuritortus cantonensis]TCJ20247.1 HAMP domain-containing histidine kinase [Parasulfuritortus cantonensis]